MLGDKQYVTGRNVRVGVIGAGSMGANHLRAYEQVKGVDLIGFFDPDDERGRNLAAHHNCRRFDSLSALLAEVDAVSVCAPSSRHVDVGLEVIEAGRHCLMEKPLAQTEADCDRLIAASEAAGTVLLVGHIERFNPAVRQLSAVLGHQNSVRAIDARRQSAVSNRILDVDVVADLMVHDIDIVLSLVDAPISSVVAKAVSVTDAAGADHVTALLSFETGAMATLTASRITHHTLRKLSVTTDVGYVEIDYVDQSMNVYMQDNPHRLSGAAGLFGEYKSEVLMDRVVVRRSEPLQLELAHFRACVAGQEVPLVSGAHGRAAVAMARRIQESVAEAMKQGSAS